MLEYENRERDENEERILRGEWYHSISSYNLKILSQANQGKVQRSYKKTEKVKKSHNNEKVKNSQKKSKYSYTFFLPLVSKIFVLQNPYDYGMYWHV